MLKLPLPRVGLAALALIGALIPSEPVAAQEVAGGEGEEPRSRGDRVVDQLRGDLADGAGPQIDDAHAEPLKLLPRIDVGRVVVEVGHDFVARPPVEPVGDEAETEAGRAEQGDFLGRTAEEPRRRAPDPVHAFQEDFAVVEFARG